MPNTKRLKQRHDQTISFRNLEIVISPRQKRHAPKRLIWLSDTRPPILKSSAGRQGLNLYNQHGATDHKHVYTNMEEGGWLGKAQTNKNKCGKVYIFHCNPVVSEGVPCWKVITLRLFGHFCCSGIRFIGSNSLTQFSHRDGHLVCEPELNLIQLPGGFGRLLCESLRTFF